MSSVLVRAGAGIDDLPALTDIYNHYVLHDHATFDVEPFTVEARRAWFDHYADTGPHRLLVAELAGTVAGYATSSPTGPSWPTRPRWRPPSTAPRT